MNNEARLVIDAGDLLPQLANNRAYWRSWGGQDPKSPDDAICIYRTGIQHGLLNGILRMDGSDLAAAASKARSELRGVPWTWWCGADSAPGTAEALLALGAQEHPPMPIMAFDLMQDAETLPPPRGLSIERVISATDLREFVQAYADPFNLQDDEIDAAFEREKAFPTSSGRIERFVGRINDVAVATTTAYISRGILGIYNVATQHAFRGRGIATALTDAALMFGRRRGMRVATLQASDMGAPVYWAMGFETVGHYRLFQLS